MENLSQEDVQNPRWQDKVLQWVRLLQSADTLVEIEQQLITILPWRVAAVYKIDEAHNRIRANSIKGYEQMGIREAEFELLPANNLISYVFLRKETVSILQKQDLQNYQISGLGRRAWRELQLEKAAGIPLIHSGQTVGAIFIAGSDQEDFSQNALEALELIAPMLAFLIIKQGILEVLEAENRAFRWIQEMSQILLFVQDESELWRQFRDMLMQIGNINGGVYALNYNEEWVVEDVFGTLSGYKAQLTLDFPRWLEKRTADNWQVNPIVWTKPNTRILPPYIDNEPQNGQGVLIFIGNEKELYAALSIYSEIADSLLRRLLPALIQSFTLAFRLIRQRKLLALMSTHDALTGIWNRRGLETHFEILMAKPVVAPMVMVLLDLDYFKELNDREGHERGDEALIEIARYFRSTIKQTDVIARLGGDEFVLIFHEVSWTAQTVEMLQRLVQSAPLSQFGLKLTMGVVDCITECSDFRTCYRLADERLYIGKRNGKNMMSAPEGLIAL